MESTDNGRATITSSIGGIEISIPSKKNWLVLIFGTAWLGGWAVGFTTTIDMLWINDESSGIDGFLTFWLIGWTIGGLFVISLLLWGYLGKEILIIEHHQVVLRKHVFGIGIHKVFKKSEVKNIRFNKVEINYFSRKNRWAIWGLGVGKIKFDYGLKTYSLGLGVDDIEANYLIEKVKEKME